MTKQKSVAESDEDNVDFTVHQTSKWQEPMRDDELTLWEVHRKPRKLIDQDHRVRCSFRNLLNLKCVICLGYLKNTTIVMVCLHRFCGECIHKCIRFGMKECPSCRKPIPSRRSLKRDVTFDQIVQNMVGSASQNLLDNDESGQQDANKMVHLQRAIQKKKNIVERQKQRTAEMKYHLTGASAASLDSMTTHRPTSQPRISNLEPSPLLELELRKHPRERDVDRLDRGCLTLRADAKVALLKTFLSKKLKNSDYEITSTMDDDSVVLDDDMALMHAQETLCPNNQVMILRYKTVKATLAEEIAAKQQLAESCSAGLTSLRAKKLAMDTKT